LQPAFQEILNLEAQHVIELHSALIEDTDTDEAPEEGISFEQTTGGLILKGEEITGSLADLGQGVFDPPNLTLVSEPVLSDELQLLIQAGLLKWPSRGGEHLRVHLWGTIVDHDGLEFTKLKP